jgi:hypothetical protein
VVTGRVDSAVSPPRPSTDLVDCCRGYPAGQAENLQTGASYGVLRGELRPDTSAQYLAKGSEIALASRSCGAGRISMRAFRMLAPRRTRRASKAGK